MPQYWSRILELPVRWEDLTSLDLSTGSSLRFGDIAKVLALCPELRTCAILVVTPGGDSPEVPATSEMTNLILPNLQTLCIVNESNWNESTYRLFENLVTPALRHLTYSRTIYVGSFSFVVGEPDRLSSSLQSFLQSLDHPLEELKFSTRGVGSAIDVLSLVPGLKRLSLAETLVKGRHGTSSNSRLNDSVLEKLTPGSDGQKSGGLWPDSGDSLACTYLCPKLEVLHCVGTRFSNCKLLEFLRSWTVEHRRYGVSHLRRVSMSLFRQEGDGSQDMNVDMWRNVEMLAKETGVMVNLEYYGPLIKKSCRKSTTRATRYSPYDGLDQAGVLASRSTEKGLRYFGF